MQIYSQWENVRVHMSTLPPHVYSTSTCLLYLHMSTLPPHVYSTSTCWPHLYMYTLALHIQSSFEYTLNSRMKTLLHLNSHSGCSTAERENCIPFRWIELLVFGYFSSSSLCYMRIRKRMRNHANLFTVGKRTSPHVYSTCTCLLYLHMSTLLYHHMSTLLYLHMSTLPPHVCSFSICLLYINMLTSSLYVYTSFTYPIQFRIHVEFENENTFALELPQRLLCGWAWELYSLLMNRNFGVWIFFFFVIVLHENQKANEESCKFIHSGKTY